MYTLYVDTVAVNTPLLLVVPLVSLVRLDEDVPPYSVTAAPLSALPVPYSLTFTVTVLVVIGATVLAVRFTVVTDGLVEAVTVTVAVL